MEHWVTHGPWMQHNMISFFNTPPRGASMFFPRENWVTAGRCEKPHVYPGETPRQFARTNYAMTTSRRRSTNKRRRTGERKHRCTWLDWRIHVRRDDCSAAEAKYLSNNNSPLALLTQFNINIPVNATTLNIPSASSECEDCLKYKRTLILL